MKPVDLVTNHSNQEPSFENDCGWS